MELKYALILAAGFGKRMGETGEVLPKILWPVFDQTLLELQIKFAKSLGCQNIYINTHFLHERIESFVREKNLSCEVSLLYEKELLDIGGAISRLASLEGVDKSQALLILNGDQFLFFNSCFLQRALKDLNNSNAVLFATKAKAYSSYNEIVFDEFYRLQNIIKSPSYDHEYFTYSGMGLIHLGKIDICQGPSQFFETVGNYKKGKVLVSLLDSYRYLDFGTLERYKETIWKIFDQYINAELDEAFKFLQESNAFDAKKVNKGNRSYNSIHYKTLEFLNLRLEESGALIYKDT